MGFSVPLARWFREELAQLPADILLDRQSLERGYFRRDEIEGLIREHQQHIANHAARLWVLIQLEMWHREVVEAPTSVTGVADRALRTWQCLAARRRQARAEPANSTL